MEAKHTVMKRQDIEDYIFGDKVWALIEGQLRRQAEISFTAGMEKGNQEAYKIGIEDGKTEGVAEGIKEVVEYVQKHIEMSPKASSHWLSQVEEVWGLQVD